MEVGKAVTWRKLSGCDLMITYGQLGYISMLGREQHMNCGPMVLGIKLDSVWSFLFLFDFICILSDMVLENLY
jgi:hypothetical protein